MVDPIKISALTALGTAPAVTALFPICTDPAAAIPLTRTVTGTQLAEMVDSTLALREALTAARTYYVRTDGNNANTGLVNSAGGALLTIQAAVNAVALLDINANVVIIQVDDGTYTTPFTLKNVVGYSAVGNLIIQGNTGAMSNVIVSTTSSAAILADGLSSIWTVKFMKIQTTTSGDCIYSANNSIIKFMNIDFGTCAGYHLATSGGKLVCGGNYSITGGAVTHYGIDGGEIKNRGYTVTITGTPAFSYAFASVNRLGLLFNDFTTYSGSATGNRYTVSLNSVIYTNGGVGFLPGNGAETESTGGVYA